VLQDRTRPTTKRCACHVPKTVTLRSGVTASRTVHAMLAGLECAPCALPVWLRNINRFLVLIRVMIVQYYHTWTTADLHVSRVRTRTLLLGIALFVGPGSIPALQ